MYISMAFSPSVVNIADPSPFPPRCKITSGALALLSIESINFLAFMGFSSGGHLASIASTHYNDKVYEPSDNISASPDFSILIYPVIP